MIAHERFEGNLRLQVPGKVFSESGPTIPCMGIDLDDISLTATFLCDPDLDFFCSRSLNNFD